ARRRGDEPTRAVCPDLQRPGDADPPATDLPARARRGGRPRSLHRADRARAGRAPLRGDLHVRRPIKSEVRSSKYEVRSPNLRTSDFVLQTSYFSLRT